MWRKARLERDEEMRKRVAQLEKDAILARRDITWLAREKGSKE